MAESILRYGSGCPLLDMFNEPMRPCFGLQEPTATHGLLLLAPFLPFFTLWENCIVPYKQLT
jgi:hypothetical protein